MTASVLVSGKLFRDPERKMSKSLRPFVSATVKDGDGDGVIFWKLLVFSEIISETLMALHAGDAVAVAGSFKVELYEKGGVQRLGYTLFVDGVLAARQPRRERRPRRQAEQVEAAGPVPPPIMTAPDDEIPF